MSGWKKLAAASAADDVISPEGVSFDGSNDYLQSSFSESVRPAMTFSAWVYATESRTLFRNGATTAPQEFNVSVQNDGYLVFRLTTGNQSKSYYANNKPFGFNTWHHILFSCDSSTGTAQLYVNDTNVGIGTTGVAGEDIKPLLNSFQIMKGENSSQRGKGRVAHVFVDYTYRNLGTESNRRLFITDELKPADGLADLSPIIYLPMTDADTAGDNSGTGGDFTVTGTLDTAQRGPNQYNCVASFFNTSDSVGVYSLTIPNGSYVLTSFTLNTERIDGGGYVLYHGRLQWGIETSYEPGRLYFNVVNTSGDTIFRGEMRNRPLGVQNHYVFAYDASTATYQFYENGVDTTFDSVTTQTTGTIHYTDSTSYTIGDGSDNKSAIGEFYLDNVDIDLSADNPFWDSDTNKPKPVRQVLDETGSTPYIAMPLMAANPELNLGTGSQGQPSSLPYQGYRGASEFWAKSLNFNNPSFNSGKRLTLNNPDESTIRKTTLALAFKRDNDNALDNVALFNVNSSSANNYQFSLIFDSSENLNVYYNGHQVANLGSIVYSTWHIVLLSIDSTTSTAHAYLDGVSKSATITANRAYTQAYTNVGGAFPGIIGYEFDGDIAFVYQSHDYIDLSDEANRNLFVDQLGYPKDLTPAIEAGDIAEPKVYLRFEDTDNFGKNDGSYGDFTDYTDSESGPDFNFPYL